MGLKNSLALIILIIAVRDGHTALHGACSNNAECAANDGDANAICSTEANSGAGQCVCTGKFKPNTDGSQCVEKALEDSCTEKDDCSGVTNADCVAEKCACPNGFEENAGACDKVHGSTCSENSDCTSLENAVCSEEKCECAPNYSESNGICSSDSGAASMKAIIWMVYSSALVFLVQRVI